MGLFNKIIDIQAKSTGQAPSKDVLQTTKNWFNDRYEWVQIQRNILLVVVLVCAVTIAVLTASVSFIKNSRTIEPFVIEIEQKTGVPTVIDPQTIKALSAQESIQRYFIWNYIKAREEYFFSSYSRVRNYVRTLSTNEEFQRYRTETSQSNPQSSFNTLGNSSYRTVSLKSMILTEADNGQMIAEVRFRTNTQGQKVRSADKFARIVYDVRNLEMSEEDRLLNPLGFIVTEYRVTDERV